MDWTVDGDTPNPTDEDAIAYLTDIIDGGTLENQNEDWEENDEEEFYEPDTYGMTAQEFATQLVKNEEEWKDKGVTWEISTNFVKIENPENWEHPCDL